MRNTLSCATAATAVLCAALSSTALFGQGTPAGRIEKGQPPAAASESTPSSEAAIVQYRAAVAFHNRQQYDFAVEEWERFLSQFPDDALAAKAQHYAGVCYLQLKKPDQAIAAFEQLVQKYPKFELLDASYLNLGMSYYAAAQAGKAELHDKAAAAFASVVNRFPESSQVSQALFFRGEALYARNKKEEAANSYRELAEKHLKSPQRPDALYALGVTLQELGRHADAGKAYDRFIREYPDHALATEVMMREADTLLAAKDYERAASQFGKVATAPGFKLADYAMLRQALSLYEQKKYAEAANTYASLVEKFPKSQHASAATLSAGNCFYLADMQKEARDWLSRVVQTGGDQAAEAAHWMARSFLKDRQPDKALETVQRVLPQAQKGPHLALLKVDQADALYEIPQRRRESIAVYADVATRHAESSAAPQAAYMASYAALQVGDFQAARKYADDFLKRHKEHSLTPDVEFVLAESLIQVGEPAAAGAIYAALVKNHANHSDAEQWRIRRALALSLEKKHEEVVQYLKPIVAKLRHPALAAEAQFLLGSSLLELSQYAEARDAFQASLTAQPKWRQADETLLGLSRAQRGLGDFKSAKGSIARLLAEFPQSKILDRAHFRLGEYHYAAGEYEDAAAEHAWVIEKTPNSPLVPHALYGLGWAQLSQQKHQPAVKTFTRLIDEFKDHPLAAKAYSGRANARLQAKDYAGATADVNAFLKGDATGAEAADALFILGLAQVGDNKHREALNTFGSILKENPQYASADKVLFELAWAHKSLGDEAAAVDHFAQLAERNSNSPLAAESNYHVGEHLYHQKKDYQAAVAKYQAALRTAGKSELGEKAQHKLAWALYQQDDFAAAARTFATQLVDHPQGALAADATFMNAESLFKFEKYDTAYPAFQRALAMKPSSDDFVTLGLLHAGQSAAQLKKWDDSLRYLQELSEKHPESPHLPEALYEQAWAKHNQRKFAEALKLYEAAADKAPAREVGVRARFMVGEVLFEQGNHKDAVRNYFKVAYGFSETGAPESIRFWQASALYESARCFEVLKNVDQAKKLYAELLEKYPKSDKSDLAKQRLTALK